MKPEENFKAARQTIIALLNQGCDLADGMITCDNGHNITRIALQACGYLGELYTLLP